MILHYIIKIYLIINFKIVTYDIKLKLIDSNLL